MKICEKKNQNKYHAVKIPVAISGKTNNNTDLFCVFFLSSSKISLFENSPTVSETNTDFYQSILFQ